MGVLRGWGGGKGERRVRKECKDVEERGSAAGWWPTKPNSACVALVVVSVVDVGAALSLPSHHLHNMNGMEEHKS